MSRHALGGTVSHSKLVTARDVDTGETHTHARANLPGDYHTLCGLSLSDDQLEEVPTEGVTKIECVICHAVWAEALRFRRSDFN